MNIVIKKINELNPAEYNPREISQFDLDELKKSIQEFGIVEPIIINKDNTIIGGHQRVVACQQLGIQEVPCFIIELDKTKEKVLNLALNKIQGRWDETKLSDLIYKLKKESEENIIGFLNEEIEQYLLKREIQADLNQEYNPDEDEELKKLFERHEKVPVGMEEPEAPRIKTRLSFYTETFEEFNKIREFFKTTRKGELDKDRLIGILKEREEANKEQ